MKLNSLIILAISTFFIISCESISGTQAELVEAAVEGDLKSFRALLTKEAQETQGNRETMMVLATLAKENKKVEMTQDHDFKWIKKDSKSLALATGLTLLLQKNGKVLWISTPMECENSMSISDGHPKAVDCKIAKLNKPMELSMSYKNAKLLLLAHSCDVVKIQELMFNEDNLNPNLPLFEGGPTALSALASRSHTDRGYDNKCSEAYFALKKR